MKNLQETWNDKEMKTQGDTSLWTAGRSAVSSSPASSSTGGAVVRVHEDDLKACTEVWRDKSLFFSFRFSSQQARILVIPLLAAVPRCSFQPFSSSTLKPASVSPTPLSQLQRHHRHRHLLTLRLIFLSSSSSLCFRMSTRWPTVRSWPRGFNNSSIGRTNLRVWRDTLGLGANGVSGERRKWRNRRNPGVL